MNFTPASGRKYSHDHTRFQQAPGAPKINHKLTSTSVLSQPEEFAHPAVGRRWRKRFDSEGSADENVFGIALIGAPRAESPIANVSQAVEAAPDRSPNVSPSADRPSIVMFRCRICYEEGTDKEPLISPCHCRGTVGLLHKSCLEKWLQLSQTLKCEICGYAYILRPKPAEMTTSKLSATQVIERVEFLREWIHSRLVQRNLATDLVFLILLTPATCLGIYFCITAMLDFMRVNVYAWQAIVLLALAITLVVILFCWILLAATTSRREEGQEGEEVSDLRDPPQCTLINVTSPNFTLNLYPVQETTETMADSSQEETPEQDAGRPMNTVPV
ncbi:unnamed protein product [Dibothriocephalus latus]|uniref:Uncharacterized protein n=1 Tax=Dibothriocephalus latus TaxID=60516 RepID=A0A3P7KZA0_DIBLA|nr:unnamed protein product [Dibothriocephalus latus]